MPLFLRKDVEVALYYELHGHGSQKVLFIMGKLFLGRTEWLHQGLMTPLWEWTPQIDYFKDSAEFQICVFDNRGIGRSSVPSGRYTYILK